MRIAKVRDSLSLLKRLNVPIHSIIDVGVQHATDSLVDLFPDKHHYLFEPVAEYFPHIRENYREISHDLIEAAVSDFDGEVSLTTEKKTRGDEISHSYITQSVSEASRQIQSVRLDSYFENRGQAGPFLLKVDVEGADVPSRILRGAEQILSQSSIVMIEMTVDKFIERARIIDDAGFDIWDICDLCYYGECLWQVDCIFVRKDIKNKLPSLKPMHRKPFQSTLWQSGF